MMRLELVDRDFMENGTCLYNSSPIPLNPELAFLLGDSDLAVMLQQVHYWLQINKQNMEMGLSKVDVYKDGRVWCFQTFEEWEQQFIWMSLSTIKRKIKTLENMELLISGDYNEMRIDRTKWYSINYKKLAELTKEFRLKMQQKQEDIEKRKAKQKEHNVKQNSISKTKKAKCQNETMAKCQVDTTNNKRLTIQETNLQEKNSVSLSIYESPQEKRKNIQTDRQTELELQAVNSLLHEQIGIDELKVSYGEDIVTEIELNIIEMYLQDRTTIKGDSKPKSVIQGVLNKLTYNHIEEIIGRFNAISQTTKIKNTKAYLQTLIYNEPFEMNTSINNSITYHSWNK